MGCITGTDRFQGALCRVRLRRRPSEEILDETVVLQTMFSSLDDDSNRHVLGRALPAVHLIFAWAFLHGVTFPCPQFRTHCLM